MKKSNNIVKVVILMITVLAITMSFAIVSNAAESSFEKSISAFPESYKPYLRQLHETYPKWEFEPMMTNLDWYETIEAQSLDDKSLVTNATGFSDVFKSKLSGDYNPSTDKYIEKDGGFVTANELAISYYIDPRNFLNVEGIFQFEDLSFNDSFTVSDVELVLNGNFMSNKKVNYYNSSGKLIKTNSTYAQLIYNAGKKYNVNPCYLASKIMNEVGNGSGSISGTYKDYKGIYNFYNIGAYDGGDAIAKGLAWASSGSSYGRPWTSPEKSISGGAQYIAQNYIAKGQYTGYLQRFNVNPDSYYKVNTHQYMTNISGSASQAYTNYLSYLASGSLNDKYVFSIPVFKNMSSDKSGEGDISSFENLNLYGKINVSVSNVRTGPSTSNPTLPVQLSGGKTVKILDQVFTDTTYYINALKYPYWAKVQFTLNSVTYIGYVPLDFIDISSYTNVSTGKHSINVFKTNDDIDVNFISSDTSIAVVNSDNTVTFLKSGIVTITAYDSLKKFDSTIYKVSTTGSKMQISNLKATISGSKLNISFDKNSNFSKYEVFTTDKYGNKIFAVATTSNSVSYDLSKIGGAKYVSVRGVKYLSSYVNSYGKTTSIDLDEETTKSVEKAKVTAIYRNYRRVTIQWQPISSAAGYRVYQKINGSWVALKTIWGANETTYKFLDLDIESKNDFAVRTFARDLTGKIVWASPTYINGISTKTIVPQISSSSNSTTSVKLNWNYILAADGYRVYVQKNGKWSAFSIFNNNTTSCTIKDLAPNTEFNFKVRSFVYKEDGTRIWSDLSENYKAKTKSIVPKIASAKASYDYVTLSWNKIENAGGYRIYTWIDGKWKAFNVHGSSTTSCKVKNLDFDTSYTFKVRSFLFNSDGSVTWSDASTGYKAKTLSIVPVASSVSSGKTYINFNWKEISIADGYRIYILDSGKWRALNLHGSDKTSYKFTGLKSNKSYTLKVRIFKFNDDKSVTWSAVSDATVIKTK